MHIRTSTIQFSIINFHRPLISFPPASTSIAMPTVEPEVAASIQDMVSKVIDNVDTSDYVGVLVQDERGAGAPVGQDDAMEIMNAELRGLCFVTYFVVKAAAQACGAISSSKRSAGPLSSRRHTLVRRRRQPRPQLC